MKTHSQHDGLNTPAGITATFELAEKFPQLALRTPLALAMVGELLDIGSRTELIYPGVAYSELILGDNDTALSIVGRARNAAMASVHDAVESPDFQAARDDINDYLKARYGRVVLHGHNCDDCLVPEDSIADFTMAHRPFEEIREAVASAFGPPVVLGEAAAAATITPQTRQAFQRIHATALLL